ncbi:hypothetical protein [Lactobacillus helveticus]|uniref:hypothetical protein n=1 Tax=Lactobacillus helveticus TaxID=1587 RepID=UPI001C6509B3|nr:hypothetical protein [Lactobacillus helveticus]MBW7988284.1 hypothetical protein [Lactobacillus helveticus]
MNISIVIGIVVIIIALAISFLPAYQNYKLWYIEKIGYWDILIQFLVIAGINLYMYLAGGLGALFMLIMPVPLDIIFLFVMISSYIRVRKYRQTH